MQWMHGLGRFLKFLPASAEILPFNKVWIQPCRKSGQRVRVAHPTPHPCTKTSAQWREAPIFKDILSELLDDGCEFTLPKEIRQVRPGLSGQDVISAITGNDYAGMIPNAPIQIPG